MRTNFFLRARIIEDTFHMNSDFGLSVGGFRRSPFRVRDFQFTKGDIIDIVESSSDEEFFKLIN